MIHHCNCTNGYQDRRYGKGMRVHNYPCKNRSNGEYNVARCTVCKDEKVIGGH